MAEPAPLPKPEHWARLRRWLRPGIGVKRWLLLYAAALTLVALGAGLLLTHLYRTAPFPEPVYYATLQFVPRAERGAAPAAGRGGPAGPGHLEAGRHLRGPAAAPLPLPRAPPRALRAGGGPVGPAGALAGPPGGGHRGRDRAVHPAAGAQGAHRQPHRGGHRVRRRGLLRAPAARPAGAAPGRLPAVHRRPGRRRPPGHRPLRAPLPRRPPRRPGRAARRRGPRGPGRAGGGTTWRGTPSGTCTSRRWRR